MFLLFIFCLHIFSYDVEVLIEKIFSAIIGVIFKKINFFFLFSFSFYTFQAFPCISTGIFGKYFIHFFLSLFVEFPEFCCKSK